jgi:hypothetical protein
MRVNARTAEDVEGRMRRVLEGLGQPGSGVHRRSLIPFDVKGDG